MSKEDTFETDEALEDLDDLGDSDTDLDDESFDDDF